MGRRRSAIVISDFLTVDAMRSGLSNILGLGGDVHALQIVSADECSVDFSDHAVLRDIESGDEIEVDAQHGYPQQEALSRLRKLQHDLRDYCQIHNIPLTRCETGQSWKTIVIQHLTELCGGHA